MWADRRRLNWIVAAGLLFVGLFRAGAQRWLARCVVLHFARKHNVAERPFTESNSEVVTCIPAIWQNPRNLLCADSMRRGRRMRREHLGICRGGASRRPECARRMLRTRSVVSGFVRSLTSPFAHVSKFSATPIEADPGRNMVQSRIRPERVLTFFERIQVDEKRPPAPIQRCSHASSDPRPIESHKRNCADSAK